MTLIEKLTSTLAYSILRTLVPDASELRLS